jgi:hypothetical protein
MKEYAFPVATDQSLLEGALMLVVVFAAAFAFAWMYDYFEHKDRSGDSDRN